MDGWSVVLATSAGGRELEALRRAIDADDAISASASADDVEAGKPAPDPVEHALELAGVPAERAVFVGDTVWDMGAGCRAGVTCVGVLCGGIPRGDLEDAGAAAIFNDPSHLLQGGHVTRHGTHFDVDSARLWDLPDNLPPIGIAVSGEQSRSIAGRLADFVIATEPEADLLTSFDRHGGEGKARVGQLPVCYDPDREAAVRRAYDQFRWFGGGWKVNAELPHPESFESATQFVRPEDVAGAIPCGDNIDDFVEAVRPYIDAGFTEVALVQIGGQTQHEYLDWSAKRLLPALSEAFG